MKKRKRKWVTPVVLLAILAALSLYVYKFERGEAPKEKQVFRFAKEDATRLQIKTADTTLVCSKTDDQWQIEQPIQAPGSKDEIERLIERVATLQADRFLGKNATLSDKDAGFDKPKVEVSIWLKGRSDPETLTLGGETPLGSNLYARRGKTGQVFTVYSYLATDLQKKPEDLRDKKVIALKKDDVTKIQLAYVDRQILVEKKKQGDKDEWTLTQPIQAKADSGSVDSILYSLEGYQVKEWVETAPKDLAKYGLSKPQITVTLTSKDGKQETLLVGKKKEGADEVYVQNPARRAVVTLEAKAVTDLTKQAFDLRDKHLLAFERDDVDKIEVTRGNTQIVCQKSGKGDKEEWKVILPKEVEADKWKVDDILWDMEDLEATKFVEDAPGDLAKYGLTSPQVTVRLSGKGKTHEVFFGAEAEASKVYVKTGDSPRVVLVDKSSMDNLPKSPDDLKKEEPKQPAKTESAVPGK
jgi:hypothetical protein